MKNWIKKVKIAGEKDQNLQKKNKKEKKMIGNRTSETVRLDEGCAQTTNTWKMMVLRLNKIKIK